MLKRTLMASAIIAALMSACSPVRLLNTITPSKTFELLKNIPYGEHVRQKFDLYTPTSPKANSPVLVYIHGGSWDSGSKGLYKFLAEGFTSEGLTVAALNYRLYPDAIYPDMLTDSAKGVAAVAERFPDRPLMLVGHSAGAYNTLMLALYGDFLTEAGVDLCTRISGVVSLAAPTGIIPLGEEPYITIFPDRLSKNDAPLNNVNAPAPPLFLANGKTDKTVYPANSEQLHAKVQKRGGTSELHIYDKMNHTDIVKVISRHFDGDSTLKSDILKFIAANSAAKTNYCQ
ncbi:MAG: alpha/beta hydrolase [Maricaulaceae bacterium]